MIHCKAMSLWSLKNVPTLMKTFYCFTLIVDAFWNARTFIRFLDFFFNQIGKELHVIKYRKWVGSFTTDPKMKNNSASKQIIVGNWPNKWSGHLNRPHKTVTKAKRVQKELPTLIIGIIGEITFRALAVVFLYWFPSLNIRKILQNLTKITPQQIPQIYIFFVR